MMVEEPSPEILPRLIEEDVPFWEAARNHEFRMQQCGDCDHVVWPPGPVCPECWSDDLEWVELSGRGEINTWTVFHRAWLPDFEDDLPYNVVEVELAEGPRYVSNLLKCDNEDIYRGMPVEVVFEDLTEEITLPKFRPRTE